MCGIFGEVAVDVSPESRASFAARAGELLAHRGPDGVGTWSDSRALLGHRRLAVIDLSRRAAQPMIAASGRTVAAFNGEIYNFEELRRELRPPEGGWRTTGDTEVLVELLEQRGLPGLASAIGMFAFAGWMPEEQRLLLVRDRLGKKPLYYHLVGSRLRFASEVHPLLGGDGAEVRTSVSRIGEFLQHGYVAGPRSGFVGIQTVPPGCWLEVRVVGHRLETSLHRYWALPPYEPPGAYEPWLDELRGTLEDSVRLRLRSDVPMAAFLSGGIDSSVVCALARRHLGRLRTFTAEFGERAYSESAYAREVAAAIGADHDVVQVGASSIEDVSSLVDVYGDLHGDPSALPTMALTRAMREHATVVLSGDGGDELLGGYSRYHIALDRIARAARLPRLVRRAGRIAGKHVLPSWVRGASMLSRTYGDIAPYYAADVRSYAASRVPSVVRSYERGEDPVEQALARHAGRPALLRMMAADVETYLPEDNLVKVDRASMAVGLEVRSPLLDHRLFELTSRAAPEWLVRNGRGKMPLLDLFGGTLPAAVFERRKMGFSIPLTRWVDAGFVARLLWRIGRPASLVRDVLDMREVAALALAYQAGLHGAVGRLWMLHVLVEWFDRWRPVVSDD